MEVNHQADYHQNGGQAYNPQQEKPAGYTDQYGQQYPQQHHDGAVTPSHYQPVHNGTAAPAQTSGKGGKRGVLIGLIIALVLLAATVIGLAAGLGVSQNNLHSTQSDLNAAQASL